jgi:hypothetical protein
MTLKIENTIKTNPNSAKGPDKGKIVNNCIAYY